MATIPMGNYGQEVARPGPAVNVALRNPLNETVQRIGAQTADMLAQQQDAAQREQASVQAEAKRTADMQQRARASLDLARATNEMHDAHDDVARRVLDGSLPTDQAGGEFDKAQAKIKSASLEGMHDPAQQATFDAHLTGLTGSLGRNLAGTVMKRQQTETAGFIDQFGEQMERSVGRNGPQWSSEKFSAMVDFTGSSAGLNPQQQTKIKQAASERFHALFFSRAGEDAFEKGNVGTLQALRDQLAGPQGEPLDPTKRTDLSRQFLTWEKQIEGQRGREQDAATKLAVSSVQGLEKFVQDGLAPSIAYQDEVRMLTKGTPWAAQAEALIARGVAGAGFGAQSLPRQAAMLAAMDGQATDPESATKMAHARSIHDKQTAAYKDDPWAAGARFQRLPIVDAQPILSPMQLLKIAGERLPLMNNLEAASGMPASILRPAEVPQAIAQLQSASIRDRTEILVQLGGMLDTKRLTALADQLGKGDDSLEITLKLGSNRTTAGRLVAELVQIGKQALDDKTVKKDETALSGWQADIATHARGTLDDRAAEDQVIRAAYYVRAAQELDSARASGFTRGFGNGAEDALAMVIGRPLQRGGVKTFMPFGMDENAFDAKARSVLSAGAGQTVYWRGEPVTVEALAQRLPSYGMRMVRLGEYMPMVNNAPFTVDKEGQQPLRLRVQ